MSKPTVSVILPTYNRADLLSRALRSVLDQTFPNFECLVVDDASTDRTPDLVNTFNDDRIIYLRHNDNQHHAGSLNTGIDRAEGKYLAFLDDDDEWLPEKLERQVQHFEDSPEPPGLTYTWATYVDDEKETVVKHEKPTLQGNILEQLLDRQRIGTTSTLMTPRTIAREIDGFDENIRRGINGDFCRRIARNHTVEYVPEVLAKIHVNHNYDRVSSWTPDRIRDAIQGDKVKLEKFEDELRDYPKRHAHILAKIGAHYGQLRNWKKCVEFHRKALRTAFYSPYIYRHLWNTAKMFLKDLLTNPAEKNHH